MSHALKLFFFLSTLLFSTLAASASSPYSYNPQITGESGNPSIYDDYTYHGDHGAYYEWKAPYDGEFVFSTYRSIFVYPQENVEITTYPSLQTYASIEAKQGQVYSIYFDADYPDISWKPVLLKVDHAIYANKQDNSISIPMKRERGNGSVSVQYQWAYYGEYLEGNITFNEGETEKILNIPLNDVLREYDSLPIVFYSKSLFATPHNVAIILQDPENAPSNDTIENSQLLFGYNGSVNGQLSKACKDLPETQPSVWYQWIAPADGFLALSENADPGIKKTVYWFSENNELIPLEMENGKYFVRLDQKYFFCIANKIPPVMDPDPYSSYASLDPYYFNQKTSCRAAFTENFILTWALSPTLDPANDDRLNAQQLIGKKGGFSGTFKGADSENNVFEDSSIESLWFYWKAPANGLVKFNPGTGYSMNAHENASSQPVESILENLTGGINFYAKKGTTYYLSIYKKTDGYSRNYTLSWRMEKSFLPYAGYYEGLVLTESPRYDLNGQIKIKLNSIGVFSGKLSIGNQVYPFKGTLDNKATYSKTILRKNNLSPLQFTVSVTANNIQGTLSENENTATYLSLKRFSYSKGKINGKITCEFDNYPSLGYSENSNITFSSLANGRIVVKGKLPDGKPFVYQGYNTTSGFPFYITYSKRNGMVLGWIQNSYIKGDYYSYYDYNYHRQVWTRDFTDAWEGTLSWFPIDPSAKPLSFYAQRPFPPPYSPELPDWYYEDGGIILY